MRKVEDIFRRITKQKSKDTHSTGGEFKELETRTSNQTPPRRLWVVVLTLTILYILLFPILNTTIGPVSAAFVSIPVALAGWFFGIWISFVASLFGIILSSLQLYLYAGFGWQNLLDGWPGFVLVIIFGYITGYLHDETVARKQIGFEVDSRERFISIVNIATKSITGTEKPEDAYYRLLAHLTNLFVADYAYLTYWDETSEQANLVAATNPLKEAFFPYLLEPEEANLIRAVLRAKHSMVIEDVSKSTYIINPSPFFKNLSLQTKSALIIPLITEDYCFGVVTLAFDSPRRFTPNEILYVELASNQITLALRTLQQQLEIETQLKEAKALANIERALSESERVGVDKVLQLIVDSAIDLIPKAKNAVLHLLDAEKQILVPRAVAGFEKATRGKLNMRPGEGVAGQVMTVGKMIIVTDVHTDERFINQTTPVNFRSLVVAPIKSHDKCIGTISIQSDTANAFSDNEVNLLETLGTQVSIGIDNATLLETTQKNLTEINILYRISQVLATSTNADQLMKNVVVLLQQNFGFHNVIVFVVDPESEDLVARQGSGEVAINLVKQEYHFPVGEGIVGHVANTQLPFVTNDLHKVVFHAPHPLLSEIKSELAVPIIIENQVIGVLDIQQTSSTPLTERQLNLLNAVADQLAVALNRIDILESLEQRVRQRTRDLVVLYNLITIISENWRLQDLLELSLVLTLETVKADQGIIYLTDEKEPPKLKPVIQRGFAEGFQVETRSLPDDELAQEVLNLHKPLALENLADNPAYENFNKINSYAGIPILVRGGVRGVFSLYANEKGVFGAEEMALLASIADHLGIGIENSVLFEQSRESAALEERNRLARNLHDSVSQSLYSLTLMAGTTKKMLERSPDLDVVMKSVTRLGDTAHQALKEMRLLLYELRPAVLDSEGLVSALQNRIETVEERLGIKVDLQAKGLPELPSDMEDALYHVALEALNNVVKHAGSMTASIKLTSEEGNVMMIVSDKGSGFDTNHPQRGQGLRNMRERVQMLGGEVSFASEPGKGTRITVQFRLPSDSLLSS